jgi:benzoylformate decarboxylase
LTGEVESSLEHLLAALKKRVSKGDATRARRAEELKAKNDARRKKWREEAQALANQKPMDTRWVAHEISQVLPADAMVVEETITHRLAIHRYLDNLKPGSFFAGCIGGLGTGLATALGVKAANPKRPVVCLIGDGSFNYDPAPAAYGAAQEHNLPFLTRAISLKNLGFPDTIPMAGRSSPTIFRDSISFLARSIQRSSKPLTATVRKLKNRARCARRWSGG